MMVCGTITIMKLSQGAVCAECEGFLFDIKIIDNLCYVMDNISTGLVERPWPTRTTGHAPVFFVQNETSPIPCGQASRTDTFRADFLHLLFYIII